MSVTSDDFGSTRLQGTTPTASGREAVPPLPDLSDWQAERIGHLMARGDLPHGQEGGRGAARMLGVVAFAGLAMAVGAAYGIWRLIAPAATGL